MRWTSAARALPAKVIACNDTQKRSFAEIVARLEAMPGFVELGNEAQAAIPAREPVLRERKWSRPEARSGWGRVADASSSAALSVLWRPALQPAAIPRPAGRC